MRTRLTLLAATLLAGCTAHGPVNSVEREETVVRVWPPPPEPTRVEYIRSLRRPPETTGLTGFTARLFGVRREPLVKPFGVALDENDNLCVTDTGANAVIYHDRTKGTWRRWERIGKIQFLSPVAVAKRSGVFYVADSGLGCVLAFKEDGKLLFRLSDHLQRPTGLAVTSERLVVTDAQRHCVVIFDLAGRYISEFGSRGAGPGQFNHPTHAAVDVAGNLYVTDSLNCRVQVFDAAGNFKRQIGSAGDARGYLSRPKGVAVDSLGRVYVVDANFDNFQIFDDQGHILLDVGEAGQDAGAFWLPNGIAISRQNEIFVADSYNSRVQIFRYVEGS